MNLHIKLKNNTTLSMIWGPTIPQQLITLKNCIHLIQPPHNRFRNIDSRPLRPLAAASFDEASSGLSSSGLRRGLGIDYGRRQIGVAVSTLGLAPRPLPFITGARSISEMMQAAQDVVKVALTEGCDGIVIGLPVTREGALHKRSTDSAQGRRCRNFAEAVAALADPHNITVILTDETGTTMQAERMLSDYGRKAATVKRQKDSVAATLILDAYYNDPGDSITVRPPKFTRTKKQPETSSDDGGSEGDYKGMV